MYEGRAQGIVNGTVSPCSPSLEQKEFGWCLMGHLKNNNHSQQELEGTQSPTVAASSPFPLLGFCSYRGSGFLSPSFVFKISLGMLVQHSPQWRVCLSFRKGVGSGGRCQQTLDAAQVCC